MSQITVRPVASGNDLTVFIKFQWVPYRGNPYWVPPLLMDRRKLLDRKKNPFYKHADVEFFLAERDGKTVGRIAAIVNHNHNREHKDRVGFFGFFECIDDQAVAHALFDRAAGWLRERGMTAMRGPANPSVNDEYGMLVDGFDKTPAVLMPYNPPYYPEFTESYGFAKARDMYAYLLDSHNVLTEKLVRVSEAVKKRQGVVFRGLDMKDFDNEVGKIHEIYSRGWERNWGEVPLTDDEFDYMAKDLKQVVIPDTVVIAEVRGKTVGFSVSLPDLNMVLRYNKHGWLLPGVLRLLLFRKRLTYARVVILGVLPEYLNAGIGGVLFYETAMRLIRNGMRMGEASWVLEDNLMMNRGAELMRATVAKTYRIYEIPLGG